MGRPEGSATALQQSIVLTCRNVDCGATVELRREPLTDSVACPDCGRPIPSGAYHYCPRCAGELGRREDESTSRLVCRSCGFIFYRNPLPGVAVAVVEEGRVLLAKRRSSQFDGMWCMPCGYLELNEEVREGARREFREETGLEVELGDAIFVHSNFQVPHRPVVGIWFAGRVVGGEMAPGDGVRELRFFPLDAPPDEMAFDGDKLVIERLLRESLSGSEKD